MAVVEALSRPMSQERLDAKHHHMAWGSRVQTNNWPKSTAARDLPTAPGGGQDRQRQLLGQTFDPSGEKSGTTSSTTGAQGAESAQN